MYKTKHFFNLLWFILTEIYKILCKKWFWYILLFVLWTYLISWFNSNYVILTSFKWGIYTRSTLKEKTQDGPKTERISTPSAMLLKTVEAKEVTEEDYAKSKPHGILLWNIFQRESGRGRNDICRKTGKGFNGLGLGESDAYITEYGANCFETYVKLWDRAEKLIVDLGIDEPGMYQTAICRWKYGEKYNQKMCQYSADVMSL